MNLTPSPVSERPILKSWAEFISTIYRDEYYFPLDGSFPTPSYFQKTELGLVKEAWRHTISLMKEGKAPLELGLYIHWPFCPSQCTFCRCSMLVPGKNQDMRQALVALKEEMSQFKDVFKEMEFSSLYMGGGTPTFMTDEALDDFLSHMRLSFRFAPFAQIYTEASPSTLTPKKLEILLKHGFNRITVGVQTFNDDLLKKLNRVGQTKKVVANIFERMSRVPGLITDADLMISMEGQNAPVFIKDMEELLRLRPHCIHLYPFEDAPQTEFRKRGKIITARERKIESQLTLLADRMLSRAGYRRWRDDWEDISLHPWESRQEAAWRRFRGSFLGLGHSALSHAFGSAWYCHPRAPGKDFFSTSHGAEIPPYLFMKSSVEEEMRGYVVESLARSRKMPRKIFKSLFKGDVLDFDFLADKVSDLVKLGLAEVGPDFILWKGQDTVDLSVQLKRLYSPDIIAAILKAESRAFGEFQSRLERKELDWKKLIFEGQAEHDTMAYYDPRVWPEGSQRNNRSNWEAQI